LIIKIEGLFELIVSMPISIRITTQKQYSEDKH